MFGFSSRSRRKAPASRGTAFRPTLEMLETRNCPSTITLSVVASPSSKVITVSGQVTNTPNPAGQTVDFSGVIVGSMVTDANGNFSGTMTASGQGTAYAATDDGQSNIAQAAVTDPQAATEMTDFGASEGLGDVWTFSGQVLGGYQGQSVYLSGIKDLNGATTTTSANGDWEYTVQLDGQTDDNGMAEVYSADAWGVQSNTQAMYVFQTNTIGGTGVGMPPPL